MKVLLAAAAIITIAIPTPVQAGIVGYIYGKTKVEELLKEDGFTNIVVSKAWINRSPIQCSDSPIYSYAARYHGRAVTGFACYRGMVWGAKYWND